MSSLTVVKLAALGLIGGLSIFAILPHVSRAAAGGFLTGLAVHLIWDVIAGGMLFSLGWQLSGRRHCHHDHRKNCCDNPLHKGGST